MKRKLRKFSEGGTLTDRWGNAVRSGSGEAITTGSGKSAKKEKREVPIEERSVSSKEYNAKYPSPKSAAAAAEDTPAEERRSRKEESASTSASSNPDTKATPVSLDRPVERRRFTDTPSYPLTLSAESKADLAGFRADDVDYRPSPLKEMVDNLRDRLAKIRGKESSVADEEAALERMKERLKKSKATKKYTPTTEFKKGGKVSAASKRGDGCAQRGKTKGRMV